MGATGVAGAVRVVGACGELLELRMVLPDIWPDDGRKILLKLVINTQNVSGSMSKFWSEVLIL